MPAALLPQNLPFISVCQPRWDDMFRDVIRENACGRESEKLGFMKGEQTREAKVPWVIASLRQAPQSLLEAGRLRRPFSLVCRFLPRNSGFSALRRWLVAARGGLASRWQLR